MDQQSQTKTLTVAIQQFLLLPGEPLSKVREMYKELSAQDRDDLKREFAAIGVEITS